MYGVIEQVLDMFYTDDLCIAVQNTYYLSECLSWFDLLTEIDSFLHDLE